MAAALDANGFSRTSLDAWPQPTELLDVIGESAISYVDRALIYSRPGATWGQARIAAVKIDLGHGRVLGKPVVLMDGIETKGMAGAMAAMSANGGLAYFASAPTEIMQIIDERGSIIAELPPLAAPNRLVARRKTNRDVHRGGWRQGTGDRRL